jgi:hypothetical protein
MKMATPGLCCSRVLGGRPFLDCNAAAEALETLGGGAFGLPPSDEDAL